MTAHELLGVAADAGEREIKKAFRRLAMQWHPDRNTDPAALEHFKALRAAYESLLAGLARGDGDADADEPDGDGPDTAPRGADRRQDLGLSLEEAFLGCEKRVCLDEETACATCDGSGEETLTHTRLCTACHGSGRIRTPGGLAGCEDCGGRGYLSRQTCSACDGSGHEPGRRTVSVKVPAGMLDGDELRLAGEGEAPAAEAGLPGDLRLRIRLAPHPLFRLDGRDLILSRPVSALRMLVGGALRVPVPGGARSVTLPAGSAAPRALRIEGAGFPGRGEAPAGALIVQLVPVMPADPDAAAARLIERLERELGRDPARHLPELATWEANWLPQADRPG